MSKSVRVTIGVPVYNEAEYIVETISSLKQQTSQDFKVVVSDNCSTDSTSEIIRGQIAGDDRFRLVVHPSNLGALFNFEYLLRAAKTEYFMWVGGHDQLGHNAIERLSSILSNDPNTSMAMAYPHSMSESGNREGPWAEAVYNFNGSPLERYLNSASQLGNCTIFHSMFRCDVARSFRFEPVFGADLPFISMLLWHGRLKYDDRSSYYRRIFPEERTATQMERVTGVASVRQFESLVGAYIRAFRQLPLQRNDQIKSVERNLYAILSQRFGTIEDPPGLEQDILDPFIDKKVVNGVFRNFVNTIKSYLQK